MHIKALEAVIESVRRRVDQGDCPTEQAQGVELLEGAVVDLADRLEWLEWDGCLTGDCPHGTQMECDTHLADQVRRIFGVVHPATPASESTESAARLHQEKP